MQWVRKRTLFIKIDAKVCDEGSAFRRAEQYYTTNKKTFLEPSENFTTKEVSLRETMRYCENHGKYAEWDRFTRAKNNFMRFFFSQMSKHLINPGLRLWQFAIFWNWKSGRNTRPRKVAINRAYLADNVCLFFGFILSTRCIDWESFLAKSKLASATHTPCRNLC